MLGRARENDGTHLGPNLLDLRVGLGNGRAIVDCRVMPDSTMLASVEPGGCRPRS